MLNVVYNDDDEGNVNVNNNNIKYTYSNIKMYIHRVFSPLLYSVIQQQHFIFKYFSRTNTYVYDMYERLMLIK